MYVYRYFWPDRDTTPRAIGAAVGCREIRKPHPFRRLDVNVPFLFMKLPINARWQGFPFHSSTCLIQGRVRDTLSFSFSYMKKYYYYIFFLALVYYPFLIKKKKVRIMVRVGV